ncbi:MAG: DUF6268 family outer membrane beta-barrel protein [Leeuwenhoekiella sp.]
MNRNILLILIISLGSKMYSQQTDTFSFDYMLAPIGNNDVDANKTSLAFSLPVVWNDLTLITTAGFDYSRFTYLNSLGFETGSLENMYNTYINLDFTYHLSEKWAFSTDFNTAIISTLTEPVTSEDVFFTGGLFVIKNGGTENLPTQIKAGLGYYNFTGIPQILPVVSFSQQLDENLFYKIGFPETLITYSLNQRSRINAVAQLDGYYAHLSNPVILQTTNATNASVSSTTLSLGYEYDMDEYWSYNFKAGYLIDNDYDLRDSADDKIYSFDMPTRPFFSTGIKFNLKH